MPNVKIYNAIPNVGIKNYYPNVSVSSFQTTRDSDPTITVTPGMPMGLLLALTYTDNPPLPFYGDQRPNVRILNT